MSFIALCLVVASMPFSIQFNSIAIIILATLRLPIIFKRTFLESIMGSKAILLGILLYFILLVSIIYTSNLQDGFFELEKKLSFFLLPLVLSTFTITQQMLEKVMKVFVYSCLVGLAICLVVAVVKNFEYTSERNLPWTYIHHWNFTYHYLSGAIGIHAIYFSLYLSFCFFICLLELINYHKVLRINKFLILLLLIFIFYCLILLSARTVLLTTFVLLLAILFLYFRSHNQIKLFFATLIILLILVTIITYLNDVTRIRFLNLINFISGSKVELFSGGLDLRLRQWSAIYNCVIKTNPILGIGVGDAHESYNLAYKVYNIQKALGHNYNAHNMFIEITATNGLIGLSTLLGYLALSTKQSILEKNFLHLLLLLLISAAGVTESILNTQKGIIFILFFNSIFLLANKRK